MLITLFELKRRKHTFSGTTEAVSIPTTVSWNEREYTVTSIGNSAFSDCSSLSNVWFDGNAPTVDLNIFLNTASGAVAYVHRTATGFPAEGQLWNRLIVRYRTVTTAQPEANTIVSESSTTDKFMVPTNEAQGAAHIINSTVIK